MSEAVRCWLVERDYDDEDLITLVYATPDGRRQLTQQKSATLLGRQAITAAIAVDADRLEPVPRTDRDRYANEATRMADRHDPDDEV
ncbi:MAG: hypothetical protein ACOCYZ_01500 [Halococcoides sp.]